MDYFVEKLNIEAGGQAAIGVYEGLGANAKKGYKAHVAANRFDLNTLPVCGDKTRSGDLCKHKGNLLVVGVNYMAAHPQGQSIPLVAHATHVTPMALELRKR
jgi:hypothetical protein